MGNLAYQDDIFKKRREEMYDGKIYAMAPPSVNHNIVSGKLYRIFGNYLQGKPCAVFGDGVLVQLTEKDKVIPDVTIVCNKDIIQKKGIFGSPDLVVEVLSTGTAKRDRGYKKNLYEKCGVKEYWIVGIETRTIEVYILKENKYELDEMYTIFPDDDLEDMTEEERNSVKYEFSPSMFADLTIKIVDVFDGMY